MGGHVCTANLCQGGLGFAEISFEEFFFRGKGVEGGGD